jgi:hypothetical protein
MATLRVRTPDGAERTVALGRRITSLGRAAENDVALADPALPETALHVHFDGRSWEAACHGGAQMTVNGKRRATARLADGDVLRIGGTELEFAARAAAPSPPPSPDAERVSAMRTIVGFSERLLAASDLDRALDELLDALLDVTHAE